MMCYFSFNTMMRKTAYILYQPYKWLIFIPLMALFTVLLVFIGFLLAVLVNDRVAHATTGVWWARLLCYMTPIGVRLIGRENIRKGRSYMIVANHQSSYDILVLYGWLPLNFKWVMKKELRKVPVFGFAGEMGGNIYIDRSSSEALSHTLAEAEKKITTGVSIIMLPEGTRSKTGELGMFKIGAFVIAARLGLPILPVTMVNTRNILPPGTLDLFPGRATCIIGEPVDIPPGASNEDLERIKEEIRHGIQATIDRYAGQDD